MLPCTAVEATDHFGGVPQVLPGAAPAFKKRGPRFLEMEAELSEDEGFVEDDDVDRDVEREEDGMLVGWLSW